MAKQIVFTYEGKEYTLEFTWRTVKQMEDEGFVAQDIDRKPMTLLPALFAGAFKAHHRFVKQDVCLLYTSDAADERSSVDLGGRRVIKKKKKK